MLRQMLCQIDRTVLAAGAAEGNHQTRESPLSIVGDARIHKRIDMGKKPCDAFLPVKILDHRGILPGLRAELFFAPRVGKAARIEDKSAAVAGVIGRCGAVKREAEDAHR